MTGIYCEHVGMKRRVFDEFKILPEFTKKTRRFIPHFRPQTPGILNGETELARERSEGSP
jgi:hypothetical protein